MPSFGIRWLRRFLVLIFLFSTLMILVNSTVFFGDTSTNLLFPSQDDNKFNSDSRNNDIIDSTKSHPVDKKLLLHQLKFNQAKRFIQRPWMGKPDCSNFTIRRTVKNNLPPVALASFPGSGNTWVRHLIESATGIYTGSLYKDSNLYLQGFWGELTDWDSGVTCVQKTHDAGWHHIKSFSGGRGIFLNRNPYQAIMSYHNFLYGGHTGHAPPSNFRRPEWPVFLLDQTRHWLAMAVNWTSYSSELLVVHYEDLKADPLPDLRRILNFLRIPVDEQRLACIQKYPQRKFRRKNQSGHQKLDEKTVFPQRIRSVVDRAIRYVDYLTKQTGNRATPLDSYSYYNSSSRKGPSSGGVEQDNSLWWTLDHMAYKVVNTFSQDPLTKILKEESGFYRWKIPFDPHYVGWKELDRDFNSGLHRQILTNEGL